jgi:hypothetical protein
VIDIEAGDYIMAVVRQVTPYTTLVSAVRGGNIAHALPFYEAGQLAGIILSTRGAAEYELITGSPGSALITYDAVSLGHLLTIIAIVLGNVPFLLKKIRKSGG